MYLRISLLSHRLLLRSVECRAQKRRCDLPHLHMHEQIVAYFRRNLSWNTKIYSYIFPPLRLLPRVCIMLDKFLKARVKYSFMTYTCDFKFLMYLWFAEVVYVNVTRKCLRSNRICNNSVKFTSACHHVSTDKANVRAITDTAQRHKRTYITMFVKKKNTRARCNCNNNNDKCCSNLNSWHPKL
jgi:hypothetical protein